MQSTGSAVHDFASDWLNQRKKSSALTTVSLTARQRMRKAISAYEYSRFPREIIGSTLESQLFIKCKYACIRGSNLQIQL